MTQTQIELRTEDGACPAFVFRPEGDGPFPAVLVFMDGVGIRPAMLEIGARLAASGYYALLPDLFYRAGPYAPMDPKVMFADPARRAELFGRFMSGATAANVMRDARSFLDYLAAQTDVRQSAIGTTGYCMGGRLSLVAAGTFPERIAAAASYHGANLANDAPESPHRLAPKMKARVYVAGATDDASFPAEQKARLEEALTAANVRHVVETYPARHGWVLTDMPAHDPAQAERHWRTLLALFAETLS